MTDYKQFQMMADHMLATRHLFADEGSYDQAVRLLVSRLSMSNANFNTSMFFAACYPEVEVG